MRTYHHIKAVSCDEKAKRIVLNVDGTDQTFHGGKDEFNKVKRLGFFGPCKAQSDYVQSLTREIVSDFSKVEKETLQRMMPKKKKKYNGA